MSGGSMNYMCYRIKEAAELAEDKTIAQLLMDLSKVLHDEEWANSCDISDEEYRDTLLNFKRKWLNPAAKTGHWRPVEITLPEEGEMVLVTCKTQKGLKTVNRAYHSDGFWHGSGSMSNVIAWMPMPAPYDKEDNNEY